MQGKCKFQYFRRNQIFFLSVIEVDIREEKIQLSKNSNNKMLGKSRNYNGIRNVDRPMHDQALFKLEDNNEEIFITQHCRKGKFLSREIMEDAPIKRQT